MKLGIIGAGNMGGSIARGLKPYSADYKLIVSNPSEQKLTALQAEIPSIEVTSSNVKVAYEADVLIFAVKPWLLPRVVAEVKEFCNARVLVSLAGGVSLADFSAMAGANAGRSFFRVIPDTAIATGKSMTFISTTCNDSATRQSVADIFGRLGEVAFIEDDRMDAATALSSCGIAYVYKYIQASVQAGVELGFRPADALRYTLATVEGACSMLRANGTLPQQEIDRVTTPGGMTIKGVNSLEHTGFTSSVITAIMAPLKK